MTEVILSPADLEERLAYWQKRLRLQDWDVQLKIVRGYELDGYLATVKASMERKEATIRIADPADYDPSNPTPNVMENSLVHELLHLHFLPLTDGQGCVLEEEQAINCITTGLISMERELNREGGGEDGKVQIEKSGGAVPTVRDRHEGRRWPADLD